MRSRFGANGGRHKDLGKWLEDAQAISGRLQNPKWIQHVVVPIVLRVVCLSNKYRVASYLTTCSMNCSRIASAIAEPIPASMCWIQILSSLKQGIQADCASVRSSSICQRSHQGRNEPSLRPTGSSSHERRVTIQLVLLTRRASRRGRFRRRTYLEDSH